MDAERAVEVVLESPEATRQLLVKLAENVPAMMSDIRWNGVLSAIIGLHKELTNYAIRVHNIR